MDAERWARVKEVFHAALERDPSQRDAFLAEACRDDTDPQGLRAEIDRLLAAHAQAGGFIEVPPVESSVRPARVIGRYEVVRLLGAGGMGEVYLARDRELGRDIALDQSSDPKTALVEYQRFLEVWQNADPDLPELTEARRAVARLRGN